jgi:hypothetical protein
MRFRYVSAATTLLLACDGGDRFGTGTKDPEVQITVGDSSVRLDEDDSAQIILTAEASSGPITYEIVNQPVLGQLVGAGAQWDYVPDADVNGDDSFTWVARVGASESEPATVSIFIDPINDAPTASGTQLGTEEDTPVADRLLAVDKEGDALTWTLVAAPEHGDLDLDSATGDFTYTPDLDFTGEDSFLWAAQDPAGATTGPTRVDLTVAVSNDPPEISPASFVLGEDESVGGELSAVDPDGDPLTWRIEQDVAHGVLSLNTNLGTFTYTPWPDYFGADSFEVVASDGSSDSAPVTIDLVVTGVNDAPVVPSTLLEVAEDAVLEAVLTASDVELDPIDFTLDSPPLHGTLVLDPLTGEITYTPDPNWSGLDEFTVVASDGITNSAPGQVTVVVQPVNDPPESVGGSLLLTDEDTAVAGKITGTDPEKNPLTYLVARGPSSGTLTLSATSGDYVYTPGQDFNGIDAFALEVSDGQASSNEAVITVQVLAINDAPRLVANTLVVVEDTPGSLSLGATDPEGDLMYYLLQTPPLHGTATIDPLTGEFRYTPQANYVGSDVALYTVSDGSASSNGILPITVSPDSDADKIADAEDNCPSVGNDEQTDVNLNGLGDACDCWEDKFSATLDPELWASSSSTAAATDNVSASHGLALLGDGAYIETLPQPASCAAHEWELQVKLGTPPAEATDALVLSARVDGGPWVVVTEVFGTGQEQSYEPFRGTTTGLGLIGDEIEWRIEVVGDELDDVFTIDDFSVSCDTDADRLPDCVEVWIEGYDLTVADADGDGWLDSDEFAAGSDPYQADTDLDALDDPLDNCPTVFNPTQADSDGNGYGDACELAIHDDFATGNLDPASWVLPVHGDGAVTTEFAYNDLFALNLRGGGSDAEALPMDFSFCPAVGFDFRLKPGPEPPDSTDLLHVEVWNGTAWVSIWSRAGTSASVTTFGPVLFSSTNAFVLQNGARLRFNAPKTTSGVGFDEWFIDDVAIGCDYDGDMIPTYKEQKTYSTDPFVADTDGDGVNDGAEILAGTNPLVP